MARLRPLAPGHRRRRSNLLPRQLLIGARAERLRRALEVTRIARRRRLRRVLAELGVVGDRPATSEGARSLRELEELGTTFRHRRPARLVGAHGARRPHRLGRRLSRFLPRSASGSGRSSARPASSRLVLSRLFGLEPERGEEIPGSSSPLTAAAVVHAAAFFCRRFFFGLRRSVSADGRTGKARTSYHCTASGGLVSALDFTGME
jgi:hypothetical protein